MRNIFSAPAAAVGAGLLALGAAAHAAVPTEVDAMFTTIQTDFGTLLSKGYVLMTVILGGLVIIGLVRKVVGKAT